MASLIAETVVVAAGAGTNGTVAVADCAGLAEVAVVVMDSLTIGSATREIDDGSVEVLIANIVEDAVGEYPGHMVLPCGFVAQAAMAVV